MINSADHQTLEGREPLTADPEVVPGKAHSSAGAAGVSQDAGGDGLAEGLQHALQLLLLHGDRQVGDVQVGGVLLLLLKPQKKSLDSASAIAPCYGE